MKNIDMLNAIYKTTDDLSSLSNTGCKQYDGTCEECPCCIQNEIAGYICGVEKMKQILDAIEDNTLHEYDPNI
jgi:hypothetical protein